MCSAAHLTAMLLLRSPAPLTAVSIDASARNEWSYLHSYMASGLGNLMEQVIVHRPPSASYACSKLVTDAPQGLPPIEPPPPVPPFEVQDRFRREFCHAAAGWPRAGALSRFPHSAERLNNMVSDVEVSRLDKGNFQGVNRRTDHRVGGAEANRMWPGLPAFVSALPHMCQQACQQAEAALATADVLLGDHTIMLAMGPSSSRKPGCCCNTQRFDPGRARGGARAGAGRVRCRPREWPHDGPPI